MLFPIFLAISSILYGNPTIDKVITIQGVIKNSHESIPYIYVICLGGESLSGDSIKVINNKYTCKIKTDHAAFITFYSKPFSDPASSEDRNHFVTMAEPGICKIVSTDSFSNIRVASSRAAIEYRELEQKRLENSKERQNVINLRDSLIKIDNIPDSTMLRLGRQIAKMFMERDRFYLDFATSNPTSLITPSVLSVYFMQVSDAEVLENAPIYDRLAQEGKNSTFGKEIKSIIEEAKIGIGTMAPLFTQSDTSGNMISLKSIKGKYVLIDFWASWCVPCRNEHPYLTKAFNDFHDKGFTIVSISLDKAAAKGKWLNAIKSDGLTWYNLSDLNGFENEVAKLYHINAVPQNYLIDPEGKIIGKRLRTGKLEEKLSEIFSAK